MYRVWSLVLRLTLSALPYFLRLFPGPYRAGIPGRLVPVGSDCVSRRGAVSRGSAHPRSEKRVGVRSGVGPSLSIEEAVQRRAGDRSERSGRRGWARVGSGRRSSSAMPSGRRLDCPSGPLFRCLGRPMSCLLLATLSVGPSLCRKASP